MWQNILERKKAAAGYQAYDEEAEVAAALGLARPLLAKYDDEIDKDKPDKKKGFRIGDDDSIEANKFRDLMVGTRERWCYCCVLWYPIEY